MSIVWIDTGISSIVRRIFLSSEKGSAAALASTAIPWISPGLNHLIKRLADEIDIMLSGGIPEFNIRILDFSECSGFQRKVLMEERKIPRGEVRSYGWLTRRIGEPCAARALGNALAANPFPLIIPCHRAIRSDGGIGGFQGGPGMKRALLEMEGIAFCPSGRVQSEFLS
ncbi:MAG: methylated-DNA--[protein]-cysteine S-methyltransferase [Candidatus Aegiribacteria sp.]|nr:methylated-DNA--[protein]-cysteine S-methyltransferase [Candidatus Aegiribacteria sp.]